MSGFKPMPNRYRGLTYAILLFVVLATANARTISCTTQSKQAELSVDDRDEMQAKSVATIVLKLFHNNELSKLYRERVSDLQKETGLTTEAKAIEAYTPMVLAIPGEPMERRLLNIRRIDLLPIFFRDHKADYCILVYLSKYASGDWHEEIYLVKEHGEWKVAALLIKMAF